MNKDIAQLKQEIESLETHIKSLESMHQYCPVCGKLGHKVDMVKEYISEERPPINPFLNYMSFATEKYFHPECYAKYYKRHLCECGCGKWKDNKKEKNDG